MDSDSLEEFLTKVLSASNADELGGEVLGVLKQWKDELQPENPNIVSMPPAVDLIQEEHKHVTDIEEPKEKLN